MIEIEPSTLRILNAKGQTIGTGFLVSKTLAVTCAHVAMAASPDGENRIRAQFTGQKQPITAKMLDAFLDLDRDVAILELESAPEGVQPLRLGLAAQCQPGNPFYSFGYTTAANIQGIIARGAIDGYLPQHRLLQLQAPQADHGISGAPVLDEKRGVVVGMITKGHTELGRFTINSSPRLPFCRIEIPSSRVLIYYIQYNQRVQTSIQTRTFRLPYKGSGK